MGLREALEQIKALTEIPFAHTAGDNELIYQIATEALAQQPDTIPNEHPQEWKGVDGAIAFHLIERHAEGWAQTGEMMNDWLVANQQPAAVVELTDDDVIRFAQTVKFKGRFVEAMREVLAFAKQGGM